MNESIFVTNLDLITTHACSSLEKKKKEKKNVISSNFHEFGLSLHIYLVGHVKISSKQTTICVYIIISKYIYIQNQFSL